MKAKLFRLIFVGIFLMSGMPICAQTYICLQKDVDAVVVSSDRHLKLYKHSTLKVADPLKVRIDSMTEDAKLSQINIDGGLTKGAVFNVIKFDKDLSKIHYNDNKKERYAVPGVSISVNYITVVDGIEYLIKENDAKKINLNSERTDLYKNFFKYDETNNSLVYAPTGSEMLPDGSKLVVDGVIISNVKENEPIQVNMDSKIRLILSSEGTYFLDELFNTSDLKKIPINPEVPEDDNIIYYIIGVVIALFFILYLVYFFMKLQKEKNNKTEEEHEDEFDNYSRVDSKPSNKDRKKQENGNKAEELPSDISQELKHIIQQFNEIKNSLNHSASVLSKNSATIADGKEVEKLRKEISNQKEEIEKKDKKLRENQEQIKELSIKNEKLEEANQLDKGTLVIADGKSFAQKANELLTVCRKGEEIIKQYLSSLTESDNIKMSYFLANYIKEMPSKSRDQWNGVISTLSIKGFINDLEITRYLQSESDQIGWLKKHFIEDFLQSYISPLVIMLDQIRCAKQFKITTIAPSNIEEAINEIIKKCKEIGVTVKYKPLFKLITKDDKECVIDEIDPDLPKEIKSLVSVEENVPLYFVHIGVVAEGVKDDKTVCIAKL